MVKLDKNAVVYKSNPILEGKFPKGLSAREMDLLTVLFTTIGRDDKDLSVVRLQIKELIELFGLQASNSAYELIAEVSKSLLSRVIEIDNKSTKVLTQFQILSVATYFYGKGYAEFCFHDRLKPYLLDLKQYAKYNLENLLNLDSIYAKRIYELINQYRNTDKDFSGQWRREISIKNLREYLGIDKKQYKLYGHLKDRVIKFSIDKINKTTNLEVSFEELKDGRKVESIIFIASEKKTEINNFVGLVSDESNKKEITPEQVELIDILCDKYNISPKRVAEDLVLNHPLEKINEALLSLDFKKMKKEEVRSEAGYIIKYVTDGYFDLGAVKQIESQKKKQEEQEKISQERNKEQIKNKIIELERAYRNKCTEMILQWCEQNDEQTYFKYVRDFKEFAQNQNDYLFKMAGVGIEKNGVTSPTVSKYFYNFLVLQGSLIPYTVEQFFADNGEDYQLLKSQSE